MIRKRDGIELTGIQIPKYQQVALKKLGMPEKLSAASYLEKVVDEHLKKKKLLV